MDTSSPFLNIFMDITSATLIRPLFMSKPENEKMDTFASIINSAKVLKLVLQKREVCNTDSEIRWENIEDDFIKIINSFISGYNRNPNQPFFAWLDSIVVYDYYNGVFINGDKLPIDGLPEEIEIHEKHSIEMVQEQAIEAFKNIETIRGQLILVFLDMLHKQEPVVVIEKNAWKS